MRLIARISVTAAVAGVAVLGVASLANADEHMPVGPLGEGHSPPAPLAPPPTVTPLDSHTP